ncbi:MAG: GNAT family N-acetyltransferase [Marinirhabdus sp.]|nr:GNAT family N-acetyltransferase [Marinirhabdus sp.]
MNLEISENTEQNRFEAKIGDKKAILEFIRSDGKMYLTHTEVPKQLEGNGVGSALVEHALAVIEDEKRKLVPSCPFVASYVEKNPEYVHLLAGHNNK